MAQIPRSAEWLAATSVPHRVRSRVLGKLDQAIARHEKEPTPENVTRIRIALGAWIDTKGPAWEGNERNRTRAISQLLDFVSQQKVALPPEERAALQFQIDAQKSLIYRNFAGARLVLRGFKPDAEVELARQNLYGAMRVLDPTLVPSGGRITSAGAGRPKVEQFDRAALAVRQVDRSIDKARREALAAPSEMAHEGTMAALSQLFGTEIRQAQDVALYVAQELGAGALVSTAQQVAEMLPVVSLVVGGVKSLYQWGDAVYKVYGEIDVATKAWALHPGAASAALGGMQRLLRRETNFAVGKASITSAGFAANVALHAAKGAGAAAAPAVGATVAAAQAARVVAMFAMQVREAVLMHKALKNPSKMNFKVFRKCPLLGCYLLVGASDSELLAILWDEFGQAGYMEEMGKLIKPLKSLQETASDLIKASPFEIAGVPTRARTSYTTTGKTARFLLGWVC